MHKQVAFHLCMGVVFWETLQQTPKGQSISQKLVFKKKKKNWFPVETKKDRDRHNHDLFP